MDKRTLGFIFALIASYFIIHTWFDQPSTTPVTVVDEAKTTFVVDTSLRASHIPTSQERKQFDLVMLYSDVELTDAVTVAIRQDQSFITLAWKDTLPENLFMKGAPGDPKNTLRVNLAIAPEKAGDPVLYTHYPNQKLRLPTIPSTGQYDIALLYFAGNNTDPQIIDGKMVKENEILVGEKPPLNSIIIFEYQNQAWPYAIYNAETDQVSFLDKRDLFADTAVVVFPGGEDKEFFKDEEFYVLENAYQQLVFSTIDGSLAEINLPFESESNQLSVVRPIGFSQLIKTDSPQNATFPQHPYREIEEDGKLSDLKQPMFGGYYPLLRRDIIGTGGRVSTHIPPHYYGLNIIWGPNSPDTFKYKVTNTTKDSITFVSQQKSRRITKTFSFPENVKEAPYVIDLTLTIEGDARGLLLTPGIPEVDLISGSFNPTLKYRSRRGQKSKVEDIKPPKRLVEYTMSIPDWICDGNGFFGIILDPLNQNPPGFSVHPVSGELAPTRLTVVDAEYDRFPAEKYPGYEMHLALNPTPGTYQFRVFAGPFDRTILKTVDATYSDPQTGYNPDYLACQTSHGWLSFISEPFSRFLYLLLSFFHTVTHSWGLSIILLTIALRLMLYPLNNWSIKSTLKMQSIAPKVSAIQEKYKKDPKRSQMEVMNFYRENGVNPFGGCLPLLIQLPFLIGMYDLLKSSFELRGASFIPGWITNLTAPDILFSWKYPFPFFGNSFHLLPILLGIVMYIQQKYSAAKTTGRTPTDQQKQQKMMGNIMAIVFAVLFYHFPSGLNIYWLSSMLLGILQQWYTGKRLKAQKQ
ncbi:MAG: Membrane protein insertase YidC [Chlamydiae bacterium]|nr:Membrane protein insertase YidC [Chlamydiota bacterium]